MCRQQPSINSTGYVITLARLSTPLVTLTHQFPGLLCFLCLGEKQTILLGFRKSHIRRETHKKLEAVYVVWEPLVDVPVTLQCLLVVSYTNKDIFRRNGQWHCLTVYICNPLGGTFMLLYNHSGIQLVPNRRWNMKTSSCTIMTVFSIQNQRRKSPHCISLPQILTALPISPLKVVGD